MESRSHERSLKSIRSVESFQEPSQRNNYRYSSKDELNNRLTNFLINIEEEQSSNSSIKQTPRQNLYSLKVTSSIDSDQHNKTSIRNEDSSSKPVYREKLVTSPFGLSSKDKDKFRSRLMMLDQLQSLQNQSYSDSNKKVEKNLRTFDFNVCDQNCYCTEESTHVENKLGKANKRDLAVRSKLGNIENRNISTRLDKVSYSFSKPADRRKLYQGSEELHSKSALGMKSESIFGQNKSSILKNIVKINSKLEPRFKLTRIDIEEVGESKRAKEWNQIIDKDTLVKARKVERRKEYWNQRVFPAENPIFYTHTHL
uniref:Uncharacterized protein n=1 Tax=Euplotes harpa TaxID=151035 RepID=A0A7S3NH90_9SPIT|mmetsp:Transcript_6713/g.7645  ORF Transcript_6713/g.7645 Transcript_6713/m.7645 type:complete len:313 (+) Transcript_6713:494-1432(+)